MARFKAGDRVKILAGHPYWLGEHRNSVGEEGEGVYIGRAGKQHRGKHLVEVTYGSGATSELSFKGRELDLLPEADAWVPKVGDRVNWTRVRGEFDGSIIEAHEGLVYDFKLRATNGSHTYAFKHELEPAPLTIQAGKFYRTRDGRKVGPMVRNEEAHEQAYWQAPRMEDTAFRSEWFADGSFYEGSTHYLDLVAEWVDEPAIAPEATTGEVAAPESKFGFTIGDQVKPVSGDASYVNEHYSAHFDGRYGKSDGTYFVREFTGTEIGISAKNEGGAACFFFPSRFEPAAPPAKFKVGDRVVVTKVREGTPDRWIGTEFTIDCDEGELDGEQAWSGKDHNSPFRFKESHLALAPAPTTPTNNFIVARLTPTGQPRPNARPRVHTTLASAETEAQRLADRLGDEFAVYQRVSSKTVDAGPAPKGWDTEALDVVRAKRWLETGRADADQAGLAFSWDDAPQGFDFWWDQANHLTPLGRAILRKWIAEAEATAAKEAA